MRTRRCSTRNWRTPDGASGASRRSRPALFASGPHFAGPSVPDGQPAGRSDRLEKSARQLGAAASISRKVRQVARPDAARLVERLEEADGCAAGRWLASTSAKRSGASPARGLWPCQPGCRVAARAARSARSPPTGDAPLAVRTRRSCRSPCARSSRAVERRGFQRVGPLAAARLPEAGRATSSFTTPPGERPEGRDGHSVASRGAGRFPF